MATNLSRDDFIRIMTSSFSTLSSQGTAEDGAAQSSDDASLADKEEAFTNCGEEAKKEDNEDDDDDDEEEDEEVDYFPVVAPRGKMAEKLRASAPFNLFYNTIAAAPETHTQPFSITFQELLDPSLGVLECSLQMTCFLETDWLLAQYERAEYSNKPLTVLYYEAKGNYKDTDEENEDKGKEEQEKKHEKLNDEKEEIEEGVEDEEKDANEGRVKLSLPENIEMRKIKMRETYGFPHCKIMVLCYEDGSLRLVFTTANLVRSEWDQLTDGVWVSERCPRLPSDASPDQGESRTSFKRDLLQLLEMYELPCLVQYLERLQRADMSQINVCLVASIPGIHNNSLWGMKRMEYLLSRHCIVPPQEASRWDVYVQSSGVGNFGKEPQYWLRGPFLKCFSRALHEESRQKLPSIRFIFPSLENVLQKHKNCPTCPYSNHVHSKQKWLEGFMCQWRAEGTGRSRALPHIKTYTRVCPEGSRAAYFLLTSGNVSKSAWGSTTGSTGLHIYSYEAGVLFLPKFVTGENYFNLTEGATNRLRLPYDIPLTPYTRGMIPWQVDC